MLILKMKEFEYLNEVKVLNKIKLKQKDWNDNKDKPKVFDFT